jgi:hypothetical protein
VVRISIATQPSRWAVAPTFQDAEAHKELHMIAADYELLANYAERLRAFNGPVSRWP